ncbi:MAG: trimethylamine methyltransferase family protein [bacterium]|nr:trimethylamine methyltransferase family protein [bacterium]
MARRAGGRAARVAMREAPPAEDARAVRPGMPGGAYKPLSDGQCDDVFEAALGLLSELGMGQATPEIIEVVTANGGRMDDDERLRFPPDLVRQAIEGACKEFTLYGFDPDRGVEIGGDRVHLCTSGAAVMMLDHDTKRFRPSTLADLYDVARIVDTLDNIHVFVRTLVARDMETARELDINTAYAILAGTSKPLGTAMFQPEHVHECIDLFDMALGAEGEFARRPFSIGNNTFVVPPLRFAEDSALCLMEQARRGMPINLLSAGQAGATSPAALAGSLVQALAECLAGLTAVNLVVPGHPCVLGMWPFVSDLRTGAMSGGSGEEAIINAAAAQVVNYLGLPSGVAAGMADSKLPDNQAGHEKANAITLAANAGANMINETAGMLASIMACSLEALVIDNDMLGSINRTVRGIEITPETLSTEVIADVVHGEGHFLGHSQTLSLMQTEYVYPQIGDRLSPDDWVDAGARLIEDVAHDYVTEVLNRPKPDHITPEADARIRESFPIHLAPLR